MYKTNVDSNKGSNLDNMKTPDTQKIKQDIDISKSKEKPVEQPASNQFAISMERTDDITYDIGDKKIHSNIKNHINIIIIKQIMIIKMNRKIQQQENIQIITIKKITIIQVQTMIDQALVHILQKLPVII